MVDEVAFRAKLDKIYTEDSNWGELMVKQRDLQTNNLGTFWKPKYSPEAYDKKEYGIFVRYMSAKYDEKKAEHEKELHQYDKNCMTCITQEKETRDAQKKERIKRRLNTVARKYEAVPKETDLEEVKNTCKRCGKVWYLGKGELESLRERLSTVAGGQSRHGKGSLLLGLLNPALGAQNATTTAIMSGPLLKLKEELDEKSKCPECKSKNIERVVADENAPLTEKTDNEEKRSPSKIEELEKLAGLKKDGLIDDEEFKQMKKEILGK